MEKSALCTGKTANCSVGIGASISKVLLICKHMGLSAYSVRTYFYHQRKYLFPIVLKHWQQYSSSLITSLRSAKDLVWCGDGRFDSMGHSAKYGVYTMFCSNTNKCVHFELLQVSATSLHHHPTSPSAKISI